MSNEDSCFEGLEDIPNDSSLMLIEEKADFKVNIVKEQAVANKKKKDRERKKLEREEKRKGKANRPCDLCGNGNTEHLHSVKNFTMEQRDLLGQLTNKTVLSSYYICCEHFEPHNFEKQSKNHKLVIKENFATGYWTKEPERRRIEKSDEPYVKRKRELSKNELKKKIAKLAQESENEMIEMNEIQQEKEVKIMNHFHGEIDDLMEYNNQLLIENELLKKANQSLVDENNFLHEAARSRTFDKLILSSDPEDQKYWLGIADSTKLSSGMNDISCGWGHVKMLSVLLVWMRQGFTFKMLSALTQVSEQCLRDRVFEAIKKLEGWAKSQIIFPQVEVWRTLGPENLLKEYRDILFLFVDGTVVKIFTPSDIKSSRSFYNSKHGFCAWVFFAVVTPDGRIVYISDAREGSIHDKTHWNNSNIVDKLGANYKSIEGIKFAVGGDKAYPGLKRPDGWFSYVTMTADDEDVDDGVVVGVDYIKDPGIARFRSVVERTFVAMKRWKILENESLLTRLEYGELQRLILLIAALTNYQLTEHGKTW